MHHFEPIREKKFRGGGTAEAPLFWRLRRPGARAYALDLCPHSKILYPPLPSRYLSTLCLKKRGVEFLQ